MSVCQFVKRLSNIAMLGILELTLLIKEHRGPVFEEIKGTDLLSQKRLKYNEIAANATKDLLHTKLCVKWRGKHTIRKVLFDKLGDKRWLSKPNVNYWWIACQVE